MVNIPIQNAGLKYLNGLNISTPLPGTLAKLINITAGAARDNTNVNDIILPQVFIAGVLQPFAAQINGAINGANGLDSGTLAANSMYTVYIIGDSTGYNATAGLLSLTANTVPYLPGGYDMYRIIGYVSTNATPNILQFWQYGHGDERFFYYDVPLTVLSATTATTFTEVPLANPSTPYQIYVPPLATQVLIDISYTGAGATNIVQFLPYGSAGTVGIVNFGCGSTSACVGTVLVPCQVDNTLIVANYPYPFASILYKAATSDSVTLKVAGFAVSKQ